MDHKKIEKREINLLKKEGLFRVFRDIFIVLALMIIVGLISSFFTDGQLEVVFRQTRSSGIFGFIICLLVASNFQIYLHYIDSIKYHKSGENGVIH